MFRFTIRDLALVMVIVALAVGWLVERHRLLARHQATRAHGERLRSSLENAKLHNDLALEAFTYLDAPFVVIDIQVEWELTTQPIP